MNQKERKQKYFHPQKQTFPLLYHKQILSVFAPCVFKKVSLVLTGEEQSGVHAGQRVTHMTTVPAAHHAVITVSRSSPYGIASQLRQQHLQEKKQTPFISHKSVCIFHNIFLLSF